MDRTPPDLIGQAIHDVTCPEGPACRDRDLHSLGQPLATSGVLARFLDRLAELERGEAELAAEAEYVPEPDSLSAALLAQVANGQARDLRASRARIAELEADNERLRGLRRHDMNAWKYDPNGPVC